MELKEPIRKMNSNTAPFILNHIIPRTLPRERPIYLAPKRVWTETPKENISNKRTDNKRSPRTSITSTLNSNTFVSNNVYQLLQEH